MRQLILIFCLVVAGNAFTADCNIVEYGVPDNDRIKETITIKTGNGKLLYFLRKKVYSYNFLRKENNSFIYATRDGIIKLGKIKNGIFSYHETVYGDGFTGTCTIR